MSDADAHPAELKNTGYEIFVGILSILSILNIVLALHREGREPRPDPH